jgi:type I restriction-modification system DNA methylase subunit
VRRDPWLSIQTATCALVEILELFHGRILDPACGSGGMFVQSARFVAEHQKNPAGQLARCAVDMREDQLCSDFACP